MDEKLEQIHDHLRGARHELAQTTTDDPALFAAVEHVLQGTEWLLSVVEQMTDQAWIVLRELVEADEALRQAQAGPWPELWMTQEQQAEIERPLHDAHQRFLAAMAKARALVRSS